MHKVFYIKQQFEDNEGSEIKFSDNHDQRSVESSSSTYGESSI